MFAYEISPEIGLCVFTGRGELTVPMIKQTARRMLEDERWSPGGALLYDLRGVTIPALDDGRTQVACERDTMTDARIGPAKVAIVADRDATFGLMRMWQAMSVNRPLEIEVFRKLPPALAFLGAEAMTNRLEARGDQEGRDPTPDT